MGFSTAPRKLTTETELYDAAVRALMRRAYSVRDMRSYLAKRTEDEDLLKAVVARLRVSKYLDDARYATDFARQHAISRRQGRYRITRELRMRGVNDAEIDAALSAIFADTDEAELVRTRLQKALLQIRGPLDQKKIARLHRSLVRAGFSGDVIRAELRTVTSRASEVAELAGGDETI